MTALDILPLEDVKAFVNVDFDDYNAQLTRHINSAVSFIEKYTNVMLYNRNVTYTLRGCSMEIYDSPFAFIGTAPKNRENALSITVYGEKGDVISASVGYSSVDDVPPELIEACYKMVLYLFENRDIYTAGLPWDLQVLINPYVRSATI